MSPDSPTPAQEEVIWRYMDLPKFVSLLATKTLWFPRLSTLLEGDPYEGFHKGIGFKVPLDDDSPPAGTFGKPGEQVAVTYNQAHEKVAEAALQAAKDGVSRLFVNSWCLGAPESMAMWEIYGSGATGVAIRSSVDRFRAAAQAGFLSSQARFGKVSYHDDSGPAATLDFRRAIVFGEIFGAG